MATLNKIKGRNGTIYHVQLSPGEPGSLGDNFLPDRV